MTEQIKPGDVVTLKIRTTPMIVYRIHDSIAVCKWHDGAGKPMHDSYPLAALVKVEPRSR